MMTVHSPTAGHVPSSPYAPAAPNGAVNDQRALSLTNVNDINRFLHETVAKERSIDAELEQLLTRRTEVEKSILALHTTTSEVCGCITFRELPVYLRHTDARGHQSRCRATPQQRPHHLGDSRRCQ